MNSQQFESDYNKLRAIIQAYLNTNNTWIVNDFRETDSMDVDHIGKSKGKGKKQEQERKQDQREQRKRQQRHGQEPRKEQDRNQGKGKSKNNSKGTGGGKPDNDKEKGHFARDCWSRANHDKCRAWKRARVHE